MKRLWLSLVLLAAWPAQMAVAQTVASANAPLGAIASPDWPQQPYKRAEGIWECPMPVLNKAGKQWPIAGGGYFRLLPYWLSKKCIDSYLKHSDTPYMFYFHPWEIDPHQPRFNQASLKSRFRHYTNLNRMEAKLVRLLQDYKWRSVQEVYQSYFV